MNNSIRLEIQNFRCFRKLTTINFQSGKLTLIKGFSGAGKSTILESIRWCLFGNLRSIYPSGFTPSYNAKTSVSIDMNNLKIIRTQAPEQLSVTITSENEITLTQEAAQKYIESVFGNKDVWLSSCFIKQNERCPLMTASSADRLNLLNQILFGNENNNMYESPDYYLDKLESEIEILAKEITGQTAIYNTYYNKFVTNMGTFNNEYNWENMTLETLESYRNVLESYRNKVTEKTQELIQITNLENQKSYLQNKLDSFSQYNFDLHTNFNENKLNELNMKMLNIQTNLNKCLSDKLKYDSFQKELNQLNEELFKIGSEYLKLSSPELENDINNLKKEISDLERLSFEIKNKEFRKQTLKVQMSSTESDINQNTAKLNTFKIQDIEILNKILYNVNIYNTIQNLQDKIKSLNITEFEVETELNNKEKEYETKYMSLKYATQVCDKYQISIKDIREKIDAYQKVIDFDKLQKVHIQNQKQYKTKMQEIEGYKLNLVTDLSSYNDVMEGLEINEVNIKSLIDTINQRLGSPLKCPHCSCTLEYKNNELIIPQNEIIDSNLGKMKIQRLKELLLILNKNSMVQNMIIKAETEIKNIEPFDENVINQTVYTDAQILGINTLISECSRIDYNSIDFSYTVPELETKIQNIKKCREYYSVKNELDKQMSVFDTTLSVNEDINELKSAILNIPMLKNNITKLTENLNKIKQEYDDIMIVESYDEVCVNLNAKKELLKSTQDKYMNTTQAHKIQSSINQIFSNLLSININEITDSNISKMECDKNECQNEIINYKNMLTLYTDYIKIKKELSLIILITSSDIIRSEINTLNENIDTYNDIYSKAYQMYSLASERTELERIRSIIIELTNKQTNLNTLKSIIIETTNSALENLVSSINNFTNTILEELFENNMMIELKLYKEIKTGKNRIKPNVNLAVYYKGETYDINALSGGEKDRISLALTLSLAALSSSPIVLLDECMAALNTDLREVCIEEFKKFIEMSNKLIINIEHAGIMGVYDDVVEI
jgi:DNA repair exonuclease SbcCD ATPase subunit